MSLSDAQPKPVAPIRKIKIKFGAQLLAVGPAKPTSASQGPSHDGREPPARAPAPVLGGKGHPLVRARVNQELLSGYCAPNAGPSEILACLRRGESVSPAEVLSDWDFTLPVLEDGRQAKRPRLLAPPQQPVSKAVPKDLQSCPGPEVLNPVLLSPLAKAQQHLAGRSGESCGGGHSTESNSDQATSSQVFMPTSPDHCIQRSNVAAPRTLTNTQQQQQQQPRRPAVNAGSAAAVADVAPGRPVATRSVATCTRGVQVGASDFPLLPPRFLDQGSGACGLAYTAFGAYDFHMPPDSLPSTSKSSIEECVKERLDRARATKREGDTMRGGSDKPWKVRSLSKYVESAIMFMEVCEWMLLAPKTYPPPRIAELYGQTSELLSLSAKFADSVRGSGMAKEALRILAERLCAVCALRQGSFMSGKLSDYAKRTQDLLRDYQQRREQARVTAANNLGSTRPLQLSPDDSTTSTLEQQHGAAATAAPYPIPQQLAEMQGRLVMAAKQVTRLSDFLRKSTNGFQAFIERQDVQQDQHCKVVCMHLAALCLDMGSTPGSKVTLHAREALKSICFGDLPS